MSPWEIFGLVVAGLIVVAAIAPWCARQVIRRRRWRRLAARRDRRDHGGRPRAGQGRRLGARRVGGTAGRPHGLRHRDLPSESPRAVAARTGTGLSLADPARAALGRIVMAEERARYAPAPADGSGLRSDSVAVRRAIDAAVPRQARWRARLLPASVVGPALGAIAAAADLYRSVREPKREL